MGLTGLLPPFLRRQFKTVEIGDFPDVLIPLEAAQRHHSVVEKAEKDGDQVADGSPEGDDEKTGGVRRTSVAAYDVHTIEGLKAEIDSDIAAFGHDSAYDRTS